jgi:hypothetical protein
MRRITEYIKINLLGDILTANYVETTEENINLSFAGMYRNKIFDVISIIFPHEKEHVWFIPLNVDDKDLNGALICSPIIIRTRKLRAEIKQVVMKLKNNKNLHLNYRWQQH